MKLSTEKRFNRTLLAASIAAIGFATPVAVWAEEATEEVRRLTRPDSEIELGIGDVSRNSFKFGDYTGLHKRGVYGIANISVVRRGDDDARYLEIVGSNLGLDSRSLSVDGGEQGNYSLRLGYSELPKLHSDTFQTPYNGMGTSRLTAPVGWAGTIDRTPGGAINAPIAATVVNTTMMTALAANMKPFEVKTERKDLSLGLTKMLPAGWDVELGYKHNKKEGTKLKGAPLQIAGGGSRGTLLVPDPIDYTDDQFSVLARYVGEKLQVQLGYQASFFKNSAAPLVFDNLYYNAASNTGGNMLTGQLGTMPDNQSHQLNASAGYTLSQDTRLSGSVAIGRMTQDKAFLPYISTNPNALAALPASSLHGRVDTKHLDFKLNSKLTSSIKLTAGYRYDDRDNRTPVNQYIYQSADNTLLANYANSATQSTRRWNMPLSKTKEVLFGDLDFHLGKATTLKLAYDYDRVKHTYEPTSGDKEQTIKAEVKHRFNEMASGGLSYAYSDRDAANYDGGLALQDTYTAVYLASLCVTPNTFVYKGVVTACTAAPSATTTNTSPWLDTPALRKFFLTDRKRDKLRAFASFAPNDRLDLQIGGSYYDEKYPDAESGYGLKRAKGMTFNFDASLKATDAVTGTFFLSLDDFKSDTNGHNGASGAGVNTTQDRQLNNATFINARAGVVSIRDRSWTTGLGFRVKPGGKYEWGGDLTHASFIGETRFNNLGTAIAAGVLPLPDTNTRRTRLDLFGKYEVKKDVAVQVNYAYEKFSSADWAWDGQTLTSSTTFIGTGISSPSYSVHMIGASVSYKFQ
ncbi:MAG: MtrB/PioB family decaheme-associated outer membrane protein [Sulfuritalea sp.]|nr:MtrB/PioB family decaheme-associated outer membrane protein [Sulfuritalea sp.]